jgi:dinuclear metal center YbgI/SA1388 family protein
MPLSSIMNYTNALLRISDFSDYCPNGLQVEGRADIGHLICGVSACIELFEKAITRKADAILVHHGLIWYGRQPTYTGPYGQRLRLLMDNRINLLAYHLPLDAHIELGNAAVLARFLDLDNITPALPYKGENIGVVAEAPGLTIDQFSARWQAFATREAMVFPFGPEHIFKVIIATGAAHKEIETAAAAGADLFLSGEANEQSMHIAKEAGIHFVSAGHHETEKYGIQALAGHLAEKFALSWEFIDIPNPV